MKEKGKKSLLEGGILLVLFLIWTFLIQIVDRKPLGQNGTEIGFAAFNCWFHRLTGVNMTLYTVTDWMGLVPLFVCIIFAGIGFSQFVRRRSIFKVDSDILILGVYYIIVMMCYSFFEMIPINYRPVLIDGFLEASYPSSTVLLVLAVMPTLVEQINRRMEKGRIRRMLGLLSAAFSLFMVWGRLISGVHWITDIAGSVLLSFGLFCMYQAFVRFAIYKKEKQQEECFGVW